MIAVVRHCVGKDEFTIEELVEVFSKAPHNVPEADILRVGEEVVQNYGRRSGRGGNKDKLFSASMEMVSMITDYEELKEARKNAHSAWRFSIAALIVSGIGVLVEFVSYLSK